MSIEETLHDLTAAILQLSGDVSRLLELIEQPAVTLESPAPAPAEPAEITDDELRRRLATAVGTDLSKGAPIKAFLRAVGVERASALDQAQRRQLLKEMGA